MWRHVMCKVRLLRVDHRLCCSITCNVNKNEDCHTIHAGIDFAEPAFVSLMHTCCTLTSHTCEMRTGPGRGTATIRWH